MASSQARQMEPIPIYRIDLSLPPSERYTQLATDFAPKMRDITPLFDEILASVIPWAFVRRFVKFLASIFLRRVYSDEETQELRGISKTSGLDLYLLVALNVLLDSLLGCTSGAVLVRDEKSRKRVTGDGGDASMMHFRTLDWNMDELRSVLVVLEFVRSKSDKPERVIGRTITYAGFVGLLTGVRENLSLSLNFRPNHHCSTYSLRFHQILVLLGFRPSIASILRSVFLPPRGTISGPLSSIIDTLAKSRSAPCYLVLCDGTQAAVIEKDLLDGKVRTGTDFIVHTNHDTPPTEPSAHTHSQNQKSTILGMEILLEDSQDRRACVQKKWNGMKKRHDRKQKSEDWIEAKAALPTVREATLKGWVRAFPTMNETTHFGCILDPKTGTIRFLERGFEEEA